MSRCPHDRCPGAAVSLWCEVPTLCGSWPSLPSFSLPVGSFVYQVWLMGWLSSMAALDTAHAARPRVEIAAGYIRASPRCVWLVYVRRTSRGTSPVVGPHLGSRWRPGLLQRSTSPALYALRFFKFQIGFCDGSCGRPFHPAATQSCQSSSGLTDGFSASRPFCHSLLYRTAWNYC